MNKENNQIRYFFDREADVLYFTQREPSGDDISREVGEGVVLRMDVKTKDVVGFTILNFLKRQFNRAIKLPLMAEFKVAA